MANPIDENDELAMALGRLAGRWGLAEIMIEWIFNDVSEMPNRKSTITFSFFKAIGTQKDLTHLLVDETEWLNEKEKETIKNAIAKFGRMSAKRNFYIHYPFGYTTETEPITIYKMKRKRAGDKLHLTEEVTPKIIMEFADKVSELQKTLSDTIEVLHGASQRKLKKQLQNLGASEQT